MDENVVDQYIDYCIGSKGSHYDIARVCFCVLKGRFRYVGERNWEMYSDDTSQWILDEKQRELESAIKTRVRQKIMERALQWQAASTTTDMSLRIDCQIRTSKLLEICCKLGKDRFVQQVAKDARSFFVHDD